MTISRRTFIIGSVSALSLAGTAGLTLSPRLITTPKDFISAVDPDLYDIPLGQMFLKSASPPPSARQLFRNLAGSTNIFDWLTDKEAVNSALKSRMAEDHRTDRIIEVHGWVLSETAVHLSALAALVKRHVR